MLQILEIRYWTTLDTGQPLIKSGEAITAISLIIRGRVRVAKGDRVLGELAAGDLVGSALLLTGVPADVDAVATEPVRAMSWQVETLERFLAANPESRIVMLRHLASDLAAKIVRLGEGSPPKLNLTAYFSFFQWFRVAGRVSRFLADPVVCKSGREPAPSRANDHKRK